MSRVREGKKQECGHLKFSRHQVLDVMSILVLNYKLFINHNSSCLWIKKGLFYIIIPFLFDKQTDRQRCKIINSHIGFLHICTSAQTLCLVFIIWQWCYNEDFERGRICCWFIFLISLSYCFYLEIKMDCVSVTKIGYVLGKFFEWVSLDRKCTAGHCSYHRQQLHWWLTYLLS